MVHGGKRAAGFPSPADDYLQGSIDLNELLIAHPAATFLVRASGQSMVNAGIYENDILVVDRSIPPTQGKIVIAAMNGQLTVKRLHQSSENELMLMPENPAFKPIVVKEGSEVYIWGVVTCVLHAL